MVKLVCPECRHENEGERIYCHNCGGRLDRSAVRKEKEATTESPEVTQERLKKLFDPRRGRTKALVLKITKVLLGALAAALLIEMLLPPDLPAEVKSDTFAPMINMDLLAATESHNPPQLTYNQEQVNGYLANSIKRSNSPARQGWLPIHRLYVQFEEGTCRVHVGYRFFGLSLFASGIYHVTLGEDKLLAKCRGGSLGRLPIHPALMSQLDFVLHKVWQSLDREEKQVARLSGMEFHPQTVTLVTTL